MFSRIREAVRIITYREPESGQDAVIVERTNPTSPAAGKVISHIIELFGVIYVIGIVVGPLGRLIEHVTPKSLSLTSIAGALGALLMFAASWLRSDIERAIHARAHIADIVAPFFGHRLDTAARVLRGSVRGS